LPAPFIQFDSTICADLSAASSREWLETNGIGGYASSTIPGLNTRRYHGLLIAATDPPVGRTLLLSKLEECVVIGSERFDLCSNEYPGVIHPEGYRLIESFALNPFPTWTFRCGRALVEKTVFMAHGQNTTVVQYRLIEGEGARLELSPLIAFRDHHSLTRENPSLDRSFSTEDGILTFHPYNGMDPLFLAHNAQRVDATGYWFNNFVYRIEQERGLDFDEDLFNPCYLLFSLTKDDSAVVVASTQRCSTASADSMRISEIGRREAIAGGTEGFERQLRLATDQFIVDRGELKTVIAGYPWFGDWGRDTMIALPGLTLATGRPEIARSILLAFADHVSEGMLPNRFPDSGETPEYNTVDATLWYFEAIRAYVEATGDLGLVKECLFPLLADIIRWSRLVLESPWKFRRYGITRFASWQALLPLVGSRTDITRWRTGRIRASTRSFGTQRLGACTT
jgi:predicted glycogen debranching enzyme